MATRKILIVDDEAPVTKLLKMHLESTGDFEVRTENDGRKGADAAREFQPDIVFLDYMMPEMDGGTVAAEIGEDPSLSGIPVVFLTGIVSKNDVGERGGMIKDKMYLAKPIDPEDLELFVREHLAMT